MLTFTVLVSLAWLIAIVVATINKPQEMQQAFYYLGWIVLVSIVAGSITYSVLFL